MNNLMGLTMGMQQILSYHKLYSSMYNNILQLVLTQIYQVAKSTSASLSSIFITKNTTCIASNFQIL